MGGEQARSCARGLITVPAHFEAYTQAGGPCSRCSTTSRRWSRAVDRRGVPRRARHAADRGSPRDIASRLRERVREEVGLPITVGVARTKFLAKVASGVAKPDGLLVVPPAGELEVPAPAAGRGAVGRRQGSAAKLHARGMMTVGQVADSRRRCSSAAGQGGGPPPARARAQPRPAAGAAPAPAAARSAPSARWPAARELARWRRRCWRSSTGSTGACARRPRLPDGGAADALRRLRPRHSLGDAQRPTAHTPTLLSRGPSAPGRRRQCRWCASAG